MVSSLRTLGRGGDVAWAASRDGPADRGPRVAGPGWTLPSPKRTHPSRPGLRAWGPLSSALPQPRSLEMMPQTMAGPAGASSIPHPVRSQWWAFPTCCGGRGLPARPSELALAAVWAAR